MNTTALSGHVSATGELTVTASCIWFLSTVVVVTGVIFGVEFVPRQTHPNTNEPGVLNAFGNWDGVWYNRIARDAYSHNPSVASSVAFFPLYPLVGAAVKLATGLSTERSLLLVSHICLLAAFVIFAAYERYRKSHEEATDWVLLAFGFWPTTLFFRMAYSESLFVVLLLLSMLGIQRERSPVFVAAVTGLATACRPTGVALLAPLGLYLWRQRRNNFAFFTMAAWLLPLACWGLVGYMLYQWQHFGEPMAFLQTQQHWAVRRPETLGQHALALLTLEPIWSKYDSGSVAYWARHETRPNPLFSLEFANPLYFMAMAGLIAIGGWKRWLNAYEIWLSIGLLAVPYLTHSYQVVMMGHARYAAVVFPAYLVMGQLLARIPPPVAAVIVGISAFFLGVYSALFAAWYRLF